jgi:predicted TIM-barrel fold metal-dependent hydrolase
VLDGTPVIDVHGHLSSPPQVRAYAYNLISLRSPGDGDLQLPDEAVHAARKRHVRVLDERNIDRQLLSPRPAAMMHWERPFIASAWTRVTNSLIAQMCRLEPARFAGVGQLPQNAAVSTENCLEELDRCVTELGFVGAVVNPDPAGDSKTPGMDDPYWYPLYGKAEELGATLVVHPSLSRDPRIEPLSHSYQLNNLVQETLATALLEQSRVFTEFPGLKILVCHGGGAPRRLLADGDVLDFTAISPKIVAPSGEQAGGQVGITLAGGPAGPDGACGPNGPAGEGQLFFDTCCYDPHFLNAVVRQRGASRMLFGTEAPGSGTHLVNPDTGRPADDVLATLRGLDVLSDGQLREVCYDNPLRAFPLLAKADG